MQEEKSIAPHLNNGKKEHSQSLCSYTNDHVASCSYYPVFVNASHIFIPPGGGCFDDRDITHRAASTPGDFDPTGLAYWFRVWCAEKVSRRLSALPQPRITARDNLCDVLHVGGERRGLDK